MNTAQIEDALEGLLIGLIVVLVLLPIALLWKLWKLATSSD